MNIPEQGEFWKHYKGGVYCIICLAHDENTGKPVVVYQAAQWISGNVGDHEHWYPDRNAAAWVRPLAEWWDLVGNEGERVPRFQLISYDER